MNTIRIVLVEDNPDDEVLIRRELKRGTVSFQMSRVDSRDAFAAAICQQPPDLVIADFSLPGFGGLEALKMLKATAPDVPFILVSGTVGEDTAVASMQAGADDYVLKQNLIRLVPAINRSVSLATERRRARESERDLQLNRQQLLESELRYRSIVEDQTEMILRFDLQGRITFANRAYCSANRTTPEEVIGRFYYSRIHEGDRERVQALVNGADRQHPGHSSETRALRPDGSIAWEAWTGRALYAADGTHCGFQAVGRDITPLVEMQQRLKESEQRYRSIVEDQHEMILRFDQNGLITFANEAYARSWNRRPEELLGLSCFTRIHPDDLAVARAKIARITSQQPFAFMQLKMVHADGSPGWAEWNGRGLYDEHGRLLGYQAVGRDITALRMAELRLRDKERQLAHLARVSSLGEMVAGISHEIKQPLAAISNFSSAMRLMLEGDDSTADLQELSTWTERIHQQTERISEIIQRLRRFGRPGEQRELFSISDAIHEALLVMETRTRFAVDQICVECPPEIPGILADRIQIEQVIVNLVRNACDAMAELPSGSRNLRIDVSSDRHFVTVRVRDSGPGVNPAAANLIFETFFTSRTDGMGLGLAISRTIVESHGGRIRAIADAACGHFEFTLPVS